MGRYVNNIPQSQSNNYDVLLLKSIFLFIGCRDIKGAITELKKCKGVQDGTWYYNMAFLNAYSGNLRKAAQFYRNGMMQHVDQPVVLQIEEFIYWMLDEEPQKYQLHYCLGYISWKIKADHKQAIKEFQNFLSKGNDQEYTQERDLVRQWMRQNLQD